MGTGNGYLRRLLDAQAGLRGEVGRPGRLSAVCPAGEAGLERRMGLLEELLKEAVAVKVGAVMDFRASE